MPSAPTVASAALLGAAGGMRTFVPPAALVLGGRLGSGPGRFVILAAALGELAGDKLPAVPPRVQPPALAGRALVAALAGHRLAGREGAAAAATTAAVSTLGTWKGRGAIVDATGAPDPAIAVAEDVLALSLAGLAVRGARAMEPAAPPDGGPAEPRPEGEAGVLGALRDVARGVAAAAAGTAAMTAAPLAYYQVTGAEQSRAPEKVVDTLLRRTIGRKVPRKRRGQVNWAAHVGYGISWGVPLGLIAGRTAKPLATGAGFGATVWASSLVELPALGQAPPVWDMEIEHVALDAGFHLVYGLATGAALKALS